MINTITLSNTFNNLINTISSLIGVANSLTDGPLLIANTELRLQTMNVRTVGTIAGNLTVNTTASLDRVQGTTLTVSNNSQVLILTVNTTANVPSLITVQGTFNQGDITISKANISGMNITNAVIGTITSPSSNIVLSRVNVSSINVITGNVSVTTVNISTANIVTLTTQNITNSSITFSNIANCTISNSILISPTGFTKSDAGLANVDNTSDATKNSAIANLTNKTLEYPLIISGNASAEPITGMGIATKSYVDRRGENQFNPIINGNMDVWQRGNTFLNFQTSGRYAADRWNIITTLGSNIIDVLRSNNVPTLANAGIVFNYSLKVQATNSFPFTFVNDSLQVCQYIEGYNYRPVFQKDVTLSFWVYSSKTGTYSICCDSASSQGNAYITTYSITTANTWEFKSITIPASPANPNINLTNGVGLALRWFLVAGNSHTTSQTNTWLSGSSGQQASNDQVNFFEANNAFYITGVKMELGNTASPYRIRSFEDELFLCKRYYQKSFPYNTTPSANLGLNTGEFAWSSPTSGSVNQISPPIQLYPPVRIPDTLTQSFTLYSPIGNGNDVYDKTANLICAFTSASLNVDSSFHVSFLANASTSIGNSFALHWDISRDF